MGGFVNRETICAALVGDVLEIGAGSIPLATSATSVKYADRHVGDRDGTWPELRGAPRGPEADYDVDLDVSGLSGIPRESFDSVAMSHVIEHLADPLGAIVACHEILKPNGRLALFVPDMRHTFDCDRSLTTTDHVIYDFGARRVSDEHIREYCAAIYARESIHPAEVREWHNPDKLTPALFDLHRRRSIHVHVWTPNTFWELLRTPPIASRFRVMISFSIDDGFQVSRRDEFGCMLVKL